jgi:ankyrin repeat protein
MEKTILVFMLFSYIFNVLSIGYSASNRTEINASQKISLHNELNDKTLLNIFVEILNKKSTYELKIFRQQNTKKYLQLISQYYEKNYQTIFKKSWGQLTHTQKELFLNIGIKPNLVLKLQKLNPEALHYLLEEFIFNYGENEIIQNNFENIVTLIPETEDGSTLNALQKLFYTNDSLIFLKILEKFMLNFEIITPVNRKSKIDEKLYKISSKRVKEMVEKFFGLLLSQSINRNDVSLQTIIINIFHDKNFDFDRLLNWAIDNEDVGILTKLLPYNPYALQISFVYPEQPRKPLFVEELAEIGHYREKIKQIDEHKKNQEKLMTDSITSYQLANFYNYTPLMIAVQKNKISLLKKLLAQKTMDINQKNRFGNSALMIAVIKNNPDAVQLLLAYGAILDDEKNSSWETLTLDPSSPYTSIQKNTTSPKIKKLLSDAMENQKELEKLFFNKPERINLARFQQMPCINQKNKEGETALYLAIKTNYLAEIWHILTNPNLNVNIKTNEGLTALDLAIKNEDNEENRNLIFTIITHPSFDVNLVYSDGNTILQKALQMPLLMQFIQIIFNNKNFNVNLLYSAGKTILQKALILPTLEQLIPLILANPNLDLNIQDNDGNTALHLAIQRKKSEVVRNILSHRNVDVTIKNNAQESSLDVLLKSKLTYAEILKISKILIAKGATIRDEKTETHKNSLAIVSAYPINNERTELLNLFELAKRSDIKPELKKFLLLLISHDFISRIPESLIKKIDLFLFNFSAHSLSENIDPNRLHKIRTMGV